MLTIDLAPEHLRVSNCAPLVGCVSYRPYEPGGIGVGYWIGKVLCSQCRNPAMSGNDYCS